MASDYGNKFAVYKANKMLNGSAFQLDFNKEKKSVFLEMSKQLAEQKFDWENKLVFKLGEMDIAKVLLVLEGKKPGVDIYHDPSKARENEGAPSASARNNTLNVSKGTYGFFFKLSQQKLDGSVVSISCNVSEEEALLTGILLRKAIESSYGW
ncbi:MAG: hypothetical protein V1811_02270, partial [Candidatus Micrarchaeota archaeon]